MNSIGSLRPYSWAKYWSRMGHDITVLTFKKNNENNDLVFDNSNFKTIIITNTLFDFLSKFFFHKKKSILMKFENIANNKTSYIFNKLNLSIAKYLKILKRKTGIFSTIRMPDLSDIFIFNINDISKQLTQYDVCISTAGPYTVHLIAYILKLKKYFRYWIADYRDLWTQHPYFYGLFPFSILEYFLERLINEKANALITVSLPLQKMLENKYRKNNIFTIENGFDLEEMQNIKDKSRLWNDNTIRIIYTGTIYPGSHDPGPLFNAIKNIEASNYAKLLENLEVLFVGGNSNLDQLIKKYNVERYVKYLGFVPREMALLMQRDADILLFLESDNKKFDGIITGKLFEYIASGTFIWGVGITNKSLSGKIIEDCNSGKCFGKDIEILQKELIKILKEKKTVKKYNKIINIEKYNREYLAVKLINIITNLIKK